MIRDLAALGYLEYRQIANRIRKTMREPGRALVYVLAIGYFGAITAARAHGHRAIPMKTIPEPYASALMFTYVALLGVMAYGAASGIVGAFSSTADARFLTGSTISQRVIVVWLQLRRSGASMGRMLFTIVLYALIFASSGTVIGISLATFGGTLVATAVAVPMLKIRNAIGTRTAQSLAGALTAIGIMPMLILFSSVVNPIRLAGGIESFGAGYAFNALFDGNALALEALYGFGLALIALAYLSGTDLYPDLYASSLRVLAFRERQKRGAGAAFTMEHSYEHRPAGRSTKFLFEGLTGPWTIAWKEWVAFIRSPSMQRVFWFGLAACAATGALFGEVAARSNDPLTESLSFASIACNMVVIFVAMGSAIGLATDLRKPLWWIGPNPLWARLFAWTVGTSWRLAACICAGVLGWSVAMHNATVLFAGIPLSLAAVLYLRAVGLALYALFPSTIDQRGPLAMIRALLTYTLAAPPAVAGIVIGVVFRTLAGGVFVGIILSMFETLLLVTFASMRIAGRGSAFAQAEGF
jgi:Putative ABC exporter